MLSPGDIWLRASYRRGRAAIFDALGIAPGPYTAYACAPFQLIEADGAWIGGAVGCPPALNAEAAIAWSPDDISDVVLWNPRTNATRLLCEPASTSSVIGAAEAETAFVYGDTRAFFRAWAESRAETLAAVRAARADPTRINPTEPRDGGLPGLLVVGDIAKAQWRGVTASTLIAGPGIDRDALNRAIFRAARLPRVVAAAFDMRHAA